MPVDGGKGNQTTLCFEHYMPRGSTLAMSQCQANKQMDQHTTHCQHAKNGRFLCMIFPSMKTSSSFQSNHADKYMLLNETTHSYQIHYA